MNKRISGNSFRNNLNLHKLALLPRETRSIFSHLFLGWHKCLYSLVNSSGLKLPLYPPPKITLKPNQLLNSIHCEYFRQQKEEVIERWKQATVQLLGSHFLQSLSEDIIP